MSTPPPPPPLGSAPGTGLGSAGYDRRTWRAQRQAAAAQARWQRNQFRMQMRAARRNSIVGPLLVVALGVVLLLLQTGRLHWPDALNWLAHWWPAILIVAGMVMVLEWLLDRQMMSSAGTPVVPRRRLGGGAVWILFLLALVGFGAMTAENSSRWARRNFGTDLFDSSHRDWLEAFGVRQEFTTDLRAPIDPGGTLTIDDPRGSITVAGSSQDSGVHVTVRQHIYSWNRGDGEGRRRREQPRFRGGSASLTLSAASEDQDDADLTVEVPHNTAVTVHSSHGDIRLQELHGDVNVSAGAGEIHLTALRGSVHLQTADDDGTVTAHSLSGGLSLEGRAGDINVSDLDGPLALHGDFFGTTHLQQIRGTVDFRSSFTNFTCKALPGELNIEGRSDLEAHQLEGPLTLSTTDRNLTFTQVKGPVTVDDRNGSVSIAVLAPAQPVHISDANGSIELALPAGQGFELRAATQNGQISNDFGLVPEKSGATTKLQGLIRGGGPTLDLQTTEGDISVKRSSSDQDAVSSHDRSSSLTLAALQRF